MRSLADTMLMCDPSLIAGCTKHVLPKKKCPNTPCRLPGTCPAANNTHFAVSIEGWVPGPARHHDEMLRSQHMGVKLQPRIWQRLP
jgi:hypothetical protein